MPSPTPESLFISGIINNSDLSPIRDYGVTVSHLIGYRDEFNWVVAYDSHYRTCPGRAEFLTKFPDFPYTEDQRDCRYPAAEIKRKYSMRDLILRINRATGLLTKGQVEEAYEEIHGAQLATVSEKPVNLLIDPCYLDDYEASDVMRVPMPWNTLHGKTGGIGPGELWYFAARQGHGKTSFLLDIAVSAAMAGFTTCVYSLEMPKRQIQTRVHAAAGHRLGIEVDQFAMLHGRFDKLDYKKLLDAISERIPGSIVIHDVSMGRVTPATVSARADEHDLNIVDYVGLMYTDDGRPAISDYRAMAEISNQLKETSLAKKTRILGAAQINREGDSGWRPPKLRTLAQSDHLGNDGDVVLTMKRFGRDASVVSIEKNRHGDSGRLFYTNYLPNQGNFAEIDRDKADELRAEAEYDDH